jgi:3-oxoacyl-[acyl-carrier protein] reductase
MSYPASEVLKGQTAIVTGGNAGIGKAIAMTLATHGANVVILGTNRERGDQVVNEICQKTGHKLASFSQVDVAKTAEVDAAIKMILETHGNVDILVNNAGITRDQLMMKMSEGDWDSVMDVNVKSCYNTCHALVRSMMKAKKGVIVNMSSVIGLSGNIGQVNYAASKGAIISLTKSLAVELASRGIRVNCICPGFIETPMTHVMTEAQKEMLLKKIPLGRLGTPDDVAQLVLFLASPASNYITGQILTVDGGLVSAI